MNTATIVILVIAILAIAAAAWMYLQNQRTRKLRSRFGEEYDRAIEQNRDRRRAEAALEEREKRIDRLQIRTLSSADPNRFAEAWLPEQARFVDDPRGATERADALVAELMHARGYPVGDFEQRAEDISVNHPHVVEHYRIAHEIALRDRAGHAGTEDLRNALVHYRALFEDLLDQRVVERRG